MGIETLIAMAVTAAQTIAGAGGAVASTVAQGITGLVTGAGAIPAGGTLSTSALGGSVAGPASSAVAAAGQVGSALGSVGQLAGSIAPATKSAVDAKNAAKSLKKKAKEAAAPTALAQANTRPSLQKRGGQSSRTTATGASAAGGRSTAGTSGLA